jgi:hypothetical protein
MNNEIDIKSLIPIGTISVPYIPEFKTNVLIDDIIGHTYVKIFKNQELVRICIVPFFENIEITSYGYELKQKEN